MLHILTYFFEYDNFSLMLKIWEFIYYTYYTILFTIYFGPPWCVLKETSNFSFIKNFVIVFPLLKDCSDQNYNLHFNFTQIYFSFFPNLKHQKVSNLYYSDSAFKSKLCRFFNNLNQVIVLLQKSQNYLFILKLLSINIEKCIEEIQYLH